MKKILIASLATTALMTQVSFAEMKLGNFGTLGGYVGVETQKISKGVVGNRNMPGAFVGADYNSPIGAYLSLSVHQDRSDPGTRQGQTYNYEVCTTPGFKTKLGQINVDASYENCAQESATTTGTYQVKLNTDLNKDLKPEDVTKSSGKKVWWLCSKGHEWLAFVFNRTKGQGCPHCLNIKRKSLS